MIYYFSGTGNSKWVADRIGRELSLETKNIVDCMKEDGDISYKFGDIVGVVFPVYAWDAPEIVKKFVKKLKADGVYTFAVCACGDEPGACLKKLSRLFRLEYGASVVMPNNYIVGFDVDSAEKANEKVEHAKLKISEICAKISEGAREVEKPYGKYRNVKSYILSVGFNAFARNTKPFFAEDSCIGCGACSEGCPSGSIKMADGKPKWEGKCYMCMSCINRCPVAAIQYGKATEKKGRYVNHY